MRLVTLMLYAAWSFAAPLAPPQAQAVDAFMDLVGAHLPDDATHVEDALRERLANFVREVSRPTERPRFVDHFGFWPAPDLARRIDELADEYLFHLDRAYSAREAARPTREIDHHLGRALRAIAEAYAWSTSTIDRRARFLRPTLVRRYLAEAALVWGGTGSLLGAQWIDDSGPSLIGGGVAASIVAAQNLNFWWTARAAPPPLADVAWADRSADHRREFWIKLAQFTEASARERGPEELDRFARAEFDALARLGGHLRGACETLLGRKRFKTRAGK